MRRRALLANPRGRARELERAEASVRDRMDQGVRRVLEDNMLLLLDRVMAQIGHEDASVVKDMAAGAPLFGSLPQRGLFELEERPASMTLEQLLATAEASPHTMTSLRPRQPPEVLKALVEGTRGRQTWDLQDAYKQLALLPAHRFAAVVATPQEPGAPQLWASVALPFGTISSVHSFSRAGLAMRSVAARSLGPLTVNYLDDFPHLEAEELPGSAETSMEKVMEVLGLEPSRSPEKSPPLAKGLWVQEPAGHRSLPQRLPLALVSGRDSGRQVAAAALRAMLLADLPLRVACANETGLCTPTAEKAFGWWLVAVLFAVLAFVAGLVLGWSLKGGCARPVTTASAVVTVQASPAPPPADAPEAGPPRRADAARANATPDLIFVSGYGEKFHISQKCLRDCGGRQVRSLQPCRRCTVG